MQVINVPFEPTCEEIDGRSIKCIKFYEIINKLAVLRTNFIEIWNVKDFPYKEKSMALLSGDTTVAWLQGNLFTAGRDIFIKHIDPTTLSIKDKLTMEYGACFCMETNHGDTQIAVATKSGFICLLELSGKKLIEKLFTRVNIRGDVTCLAWSPDDTKLAVGLTNSLVIYKMASATPVGSLSLDSPVWCCSYLSHTLVIGDAKGQVSFWEISTLNLVTKLQIHKKHVLSLCASKDMKRIWASGTDPIVVEFSRSSATGDWHRTQERKSLHTHDVYSMTMAGKFLVSGGLDTNLMFSTYPPFTMLHFQPYAQVAMAKLAGDTRELVVAHDNHINFYSVPLSTDRRKKETLLGTIETPILQCFAISPDSKFLAYSFNSSSSLLIKDEQEGYKLQSLNLITSHSLEFSADGLKLYLAANTGRIYLLDLSAGCPESYSATSIEKGVYYKLAADIEGKMVAAADGMGLVDILDGTNLKLKCRLPRNPYPISCMAFHSGRPHILVVCYFNNWVIQYDTETQEIVPHSQLEISSHYPVTGLTFDPTDSSKIILYTQKCLYHITTSEEQQPSLKKRKKSTKGDKTEAVPTKFEAPTIEHFEFAEHILSATCHGPGHLSLLSLSRPALQAVLPPPLYKKKFNKFK